MPNIPGVGLMHWLLASTVSTPDPAPGSVWDWITASTSITDLLSASGLVAFVALFTTNRILTIGQHRSRISDLEKFQAAQLKAKDDAYAALEAATGARYAELKESRDYWRDAHTAQRERAEKAEDGVREFADEYAKLSNHLLGSIEQAAGGSS